jgi:hypothetical protein
LHGATDKEIHDAVLIVAAFCMYNRYVDGLATWQPREPDAYRKMGEQIARGSFAAALIGVGAGGEAAVTPNLLAFSALYGLTWTFYAAAGATGPVILGRAFDSTGSYTSLLVILAGALSVAAATNLLLPKYPAARG